MKQRNVRMQIKRLKEAVRKAIGRAIYGLGYWVLHGRSAWDDPITAHVSFARGASAKGAFLEGMRWERAIARGDGTTVFPGDIK